MSDEFPVPEDLSTIVERVSTTPNKYDVNGWWWLVGGKDDQVFSSAKAAYVPLDDPDYLAFLDDGELATSIASDGELADVLARGNANYHAIIAAGWSDWGFVQ